MSKREISDKLDVIIHLLGELADKPAVINLEKYINAAKNDDGKRKCSLNKSKFVDGAQREILLDFIKLPNVISQVKSLPKHKQHSALQSMIRNELGIHLSYYMSNKLATMITNEDPRSGSELAHDKQSEDNRSEDKQSEESNTELAMYSDDSLIPTRSDDPRDELLSE